MPATLHLFNTLHRKSGLMLSLMTLIRVVLACQVVFLFAGCGSSDQPELGDVSGTVTIDGKPLAGAIIVFKPDIGRAATGITDPEGKYDDLEYLYGVSGAKVGPNTVSFEYEIGASGPPIPSKYGGNSELKVDVKAGANTFDFSLDSSGPPAESTPPAVD